jgi:putative membrane protein
MKLKRTSALITLTVLVAAGATACKSHDQAAADSAARTDSAAGRVDSAARASGNAMTDSARRADSAKSTARSGWTEPSIFGFVTAANAGEIQMGQLGAKKATNAKVKAFAREMVSDHRTLQTETKSLFAKVSATADTASGEAHDLMNNARDQIKELTDKAAGNDWDKNYIDKLIDDHQKVLDKLQDAAKNTTNADLRAGLEKATGKVQEHLTKAQDIKNNVLKS